MTIRVRAAGENDLDWLMTQLHEFNAFAAHKRSLIEDDGYAMMALRQLVNEHVCFIAEDMQHATNPLYEHRARLGFIAGYKTPHLFNPKIRVLTESFWWVAEEHRGSGAALALLNEFEAYGRRYCDWAIMTLEHHSPVNPRHLTRRGFLPREQSFLLEV